MFGMGLSYPTTPFSTSINSRTMGYIPVRILEPTIVSRTHYGVLEVLGCCRTRTIL
jgi:hypothetical protein